MPKQSTIHKALKEIQYLREQLAEANKKLAAVSEVKEAQSKRIADYLTSNRELRDENVKLRERDKKWRQAAECNAMRMDKMLEVIVALAKNTGEQK